ncbi:hypothetical protein KM1_286130 [Entamoeba histolytica HM-3:IMSS]|uniref:Single tm domain protein n=2 Tax=Entamoeba histolytica TaxID=5759 RepID=A0A175JX36_ENTHI|nr:hypothetical protein KM1_286130 [Entamoeba histolytica HM-3:IMSS]GAT98339.1 single tm domain protein [Entamoeba histolytica]
MNTFIFIFLIVSCFAKEDWEETYQGAHYVKTTTIFFCCSVAIILAIGVLALIVSLLIDLYKKKFSKKTSQDEEESANHDIQQKNTEEPKEPLN